MGFVPFCLASLFFFITPSLALLSASSRNQFLWVAGLTNTVLFISAFWLFPQINKESLAFGTLLSDLYCYLVFSMGVTIGSIIKAIELKSFILISVVFLGLLIINLSAITCSQWVLTAFF